MPLADMWAEGLFQVISKHAERATLIVSSNLPFPEGMEVFPNARPRKALLDRSLTEACHRDPNRVVSLPQNCGGKAEEESIVAAEEVSSTLLGAPNRSIKCRPNQVVKHT